MSTAFVLVRFPALVAESEATGRTPLRRLAREPWFWGALVAIFLGGATELGMAQWLPAYAETTLGYPQWIGAIALLSFSVAMAGGRIVVGAIGERFSPFVVMAWCCGSSVVFFLLGSFFPEPGFALAACIAVGFTGSALWPTLLGVTADRYSSVSVL
jgi:fucose permease